MTTMTFPQSLRDFDFDGDAANTDYDLVARLAHTDHATIWARANHARNQHLGAMFADLGHWLAAPVQRWTLRRKTAQALAVLDNRTLADIGLSREEIPFVAQQVVAAKGQAEAKPVSVAELHEISRTAPVERATPQPSNTNSQRHAA